MGGDGGDDRYRAALGLAYACHAGCHSVLTLLDRKAPEVIWSAPYRALIEWGIQTESARRFGLSRRAHDVERLESEVAAAGLWFVAYGTSGYPQELANLRHPPAGLFVKGEEETLNTLLRRPRVTIVGTRKATAYGTRAARDFAAAFAAQGVAVISGLALGIDSRAHEAALGAGGLTIAVLGCGADVIYPARHRGLYKTVAARGLVMSELPPSTPPSKWTFPSRNRLLAALGDAVLVVEGSTKSGALQTADHAAAVGRPVFTVPGPIYAENYRGCNLLLRDGAVPALEAAATVEEFLFQTRIERGERQLPDGNCARRRSAGTDPFRELAASGREAILEAIAQRACSIDYLAVSTGMTARQLMAALAELELAGLAARAGPGLYIRAP